MVRENNKSLTDAIHMLVAAWDLVKPETLQNCFRKAGWKKESEDPIGGGKEKVGEEEKDEEDEIPPESLSLPDYFSVDDKLATSEPVTKQSILDEFLGDGQLKDEKDVGENADEDSEIIRPVCSRSEAKSLLEELRQHFEACTIDTGSPRKKLLEAETSKEIKI